MKRIICVLFLLTCLLLTACNEGQDDGGTENLDFSKIQYVSLADETIATIDGRIYYKAGDGTAAVIYAYINGYTGPILISKDADAVAYYFMYSGRTTVTEHTTVSYKGVTYYCSLDEGFMYGNHTNELQDYFISTKQTTQDAACEAMPGVNFEIAGSSGEAEQLPERKQLENGIITTHKSDDELVTVGGRTYYKLNDDSATAYVAIAYVNGHTGPLLLSTAREAVAYYFQHGGQYVVDGTYEFTYEGKTWYCSHAEGYMQGNLLSAASEDGYFVLTTEAGELSAYGIELIEAILSLDEE